MIHPVCIGRLVPAFLERLGRAKVPDCIVGVTADDDVVWTCSEAGGERATESVAVGRQGLAGKKQKPGRRRHVAREATAPMRTTCSSVRSDPDTSRKGRAMGVLVTNTRAAGAGSARSLAVIAPVATRRPMIEA